MPKVQLTLSQAADALGIKPGDLKSMAVQGEIPATQRGDSYIFFQDDIDLWFSRHIIIGDAKDVPQNNSRDKKGIHTYPTLSALCPQQCVSCELPGNSRPSIIRALVELADNSGFLFDPNDLRMEITKREECGSTNIGGGIAIPHTMVRDEGYFSETFICLARLAKPVYFNSAPDGSVTELLILSCSADSNEHLNILSRISSICRFTNFMENVRNASDDFELYNALVQAETDVAKAGKKHK